LSGSRIAVRQRRNHGRYKGRNDINIVPMLDVMVILVFFLIFTAVFSKTNILELNLPPQQAGTPPELPPTLDLEVIVHKDSLVVADKTTGPLSTIQNKPTGYDFEALTAFLTRVKNKFPEKRDATLLLEPDIPYDTIVQAMDALRTFEGTLNGKPARGELFPQVSLGDAPT
jgi:biopolymer transport protein ExbD